MSAEIRELAILIANIGENIAMHDGINGTGLHAKATSCRDLISSVTNNRNGQIVHSADNQVMCLFHSADKAAGAAISINKVLNNGFNEDRYFDEPPLYVQMGIHFGQTVSGNTAGIYGRAVYLASVLANLAETNYIFTSGDTVEKFSPEFKELSYFVKSEYLKDEKMEFPLFELNWKQFQ